MAPMFDEGVTGGNYGLMTVLSQFRYIKVKET
jgi:hypothetical protein